MRIYLAEDGNPKKFSHQIDRLNDRSYSRTLATAIRPLGRAITTSPGDEDEDLDELILARVRETVDCFGGDPELAIHYLMLVVDELLSRRGT